ncbi:TonB-dependent receptor domain-containing protein [Helicobacter sp. MIT 14-3879]|uniref:TonB-dependent receptor domain-containing protein n=1 Tax=Helicobacter sp. MIT 14-3879 TaxID=2040649 RepID=UPI000E1E3717|nr:TonB-dependent receptor [Helicobacter sp. MIT 14-3879]RDU60209.1 TonB-dependent receptor [Helicobacter sp. MIT 14-3879]
MNKTLMFLIINSQVLWSDSIAANLNRDETQTYLLDSITAVSSIQGYETSTKTTITADDLSKTQALNLRDIFRSDSSIAVGGGTNMGQKVYVRGFESFMMRVTLDGVAQNGNAFHHQGNIMIDPFLLKQVIVSKGVADASAGAGALKGSIAFETKNASDLLKEGQNFGAEIGAGFYTNFGYRANLSVYGRIFNDVGILAAINHQNILNYRDANHTYSDFLTTRNGVLGSNSMQVNTLLKVGGQVDANQNFSVGYSIMNDMATRPFRADIGNPAGESFDSELFRHLDQNQNFNAHYEYKPSHGGTNIKLNTYNNIRSVNLTPIFEIEENTSGGHGHDEEGKLPRAIVFNSYGGNIHLSNNFNNKHLLEYGFDFQGMSVRDDNMQESEKNEVNLKHNRGKEEAYIFGGFVQDSWQILPNLKWGYGTRADLYSYYDKNSQNHITGGFSPSTVLAYSIIDGLDISLKYAFSTRGAMPGDATLLRNTHIEIDPNLKAEYSHHGEMNLDYINDFMSFKFATYVGNILNFINSYSKGTTNNTVTTRDGIRENLNFPIINYGFELGAAFYYGGFILNVGMARNWLTAGGEGNGALLADTYELGAVWGYTFNLSLRYEIRKFDIAWMSRFVTGFNKGTQGYNIYQKQFEDIGKSGYTTSDIFVNYYPFGRDRLVLRFSILNVFNAHYIDPTSPLKVEADNSSSEVINAMRAALYEPGTDYRLEVRYKF